MMTTNLRRLLDSRTGTACDGRALFYVGNGLNQKSALRDLRSQTPRGWTIEMHFNGVDAILTSDEAVRS